MKSKILTLLCIVICVLCCSCDDPAITSSDLQSTPSTQTYDNSAVIDPFDSSDITSSDSETEVEKSTDKVTDIATDVVSTVATDIATDTATETVTDKVTHGQNDVLQTPSNDPVRLIMVGDVLMHDPVLDSGRTSGGYSYKHLFDNIADDVAKADVALFNQEVIIAGEKYGIDGYPRFNAPFELADAISAAGFDVAVHATNHTLDVGKAAMLDCLKYWESAHPHIEVVGMHDSKTDAEHISVIEKNGIKIAILNYTYTVNGAGTAALRADPYLVDVLDEDRIRRDTKAAGELSDFVIVAAHWGTEYTHTPSSSQRKWAALMLECGVDLVLGTHPHVIQPVEWLEDGEGNKMLVYWSLGNFVNSTSEKGTGKGARMLGAMADVEISRGADGQVHITSASAVPLVTHIEYKTYGITTYKFVDYTGDMLNRSEASNIDPSFTYAYCTGTFKKILGDFLKT